MKRPNAVSFIEVNKKIKSHSDGLKHVQTDGGPS
jgi:hypothetical protein